MHVVFLFFSEDDKSVSSESSDGSDAYIENVLTRKEGWYILCDLVSISCIIYCSYRGKNQ